MITQNTKTQERQHASPDKGCAVRTRVLQGDREAKVQLDHYFLKFFFAQTQNN